jgi:hypothetical protein
MVKRDIMSHQVINSIREFAELSKNHSLEPRLCPKCNKEVEITPEAINEPSQPFGGSMPIKYIFEGCCDEAIDNELNFIRDFAVNNSGNK